jgi:uncharacterized membrane protein
MTVDGDDVPGIVSILTLGVGLGLLFLGVEQFWVAFVLGWVVLTPLSAVVFGDDDERERWAEFGDEDADAAAPADREDALDLLRERYARGELDDVEFERKVERLLETESVAEAERVLDDGAGDAGTARARDHEREDVR